MRFVESEGRIIDVFEDIDGVPPVGISFANYRSIMKSGDDGISKQKTVYNAR